MLLLNKTHYLKEYYRYYLFFKYFNFIKINNLYQYILSYKSLFIFFKCLPLRYFTRFKLDVITIEKFPQSTIWPVYSSTLLVAINGLIIRKAIYGSLKDYYRVKHLHKLLGKLKQYKGFIPRPKQFNILKYINFYKLTNTLRRAKNHFALRNRIFLNKKFIQKSLTYFFYKKVKFKITKTDKQKTFFKNFFKKSSKYITKQLFNPQKTNNLVCLNIHKKFY